jgi:hypothetical protein
MKYICRIGNNTQNDLVILDRAAADFHAQIIMDSDDRVWIKDLSTKYGTRVNGNRISKHELTYSDEVRIGFHAIDWVSIRNNWLSTQAIHIDSQNWSEPLKQDSSYSKASTEISHKLAEEAGLEREEYNPKEITDHQDHHPQNSIHDPIIEVNSEIENDAKTVLNIAFNNPLSELNSENSEEDTHVDEITEVDNLTLEPEVKIKDESIDISTDGSEIVAVETNKLEETKEPSTPIEHSPSIETETETEVESDNLEKLESPEIETQRSTVKLPTKIENQEPIPKEEVKPMVFDYTLKHASQSKKEQLGEVRVLSKTSVADFEPAPQKPLVSKNQQLILLVILLVTSMLAIGWLLAYYAKT